MSKHTNGPWTVIPNGSDLSFKIKEYGAAPGEFAANMRLIAAAPEMLDALKKAISIFQGLTKTAERMEAVIKKAEGRG